MTDEPERIPTEIERTQDEIQDSEKRYQILVEHSPAFVLILSPAGEIHFINHVEEHQSREEVIGSSAYEYFVPESQPVLRENIRRAFEDDVIVDCEVDTTWGRHFRCRTIRLDAERAIVITTDVTERKLAELALEESQALLSAIVENIPDMIFVKDAEELRFVRLNRAAEELLGYGREDLLGKSDYDFFPREEAEFFTSKDREVLASGGVLDIPEESVETRDKGKRLLHTKKVPILTETGAPQYLLGISEDITERKRAEEERRRLEAQMQRAQKLESLGVLAGGIAHDFNNLLSVTLLNADLARNSLPPGSPAAAALDGVLRSTRQAAALTGQLLAYAGMGDFAFRPLDLNLVVTETRSLIQSSISKKARLVCELADALPAIEADVAQIRQIVMNLVINASEALGDEVGTLEIRTGHASYDRGQLSGLQPDNELPEGRYVTVSVSDSGAGMDPETRARIFDPFFSTKFAGRGLGLAAILGIVGGHRGGIKVESEPGRGSTFTILFPVLDEPALPVLAPERADDDWRGEGTILLADDEEALRLVVTVALENLGFFVLTAADGRQALELFRTHQDEIVCVLLDLKMPTMDGAETLPELQRIRADVPVILSSGYTERDSTRRFTGQGLAGFLQKPYTVDELRHKLREVLAT